MEEVNPDKKKKRREVTGERVVEGEEIRRKKKKKRKRIEEDEDDHEEDSPKKKRKATNVDNVDEEKSKKPEKKEEKVLKKNLKKKKKKKLREVCPTEIREEEEEEQTKKKKKKKEKNHGDPEETLPKKKKKLKDVCQKKTEDEEEEEEQTTKKNKKKKNYEDPEEEMLPKKLLQEQEDKIQKQDKKIRKLCRMLKEKDEIIKERDETIEDQNVTIKEMKKSRKRQKRLKETEREEEEAKSAKKKKKDEIVEPTLDETTKKKKKKMKEQDEMTTKQLQELNYSKDEKKRAKDLEDECQGGPEVDETNGGDRELLKKGQNKTRMVKEEVEKSVDFEDGRSRSSSLSSVSSSDSSCIVLSYSKSILSSNQSIDRSSSRGGSQVRSPLPGIKQEETCGLQRHDQQQSQLQQVKNEEVADKDDDDDVASYLQFESIADDSLHSEPSQKQLKKEELQLMDDEDDIFEIMVKLEAEGTLEEEEENVETEEMALDENDESGCLLSEVFNHPILKFDPEYSLCHKVISWILEENDFALPKLNRSGNMFRSVSGKKREGFCRLFPEYRSGKFSSDEDLIVIKRLQVLMKRLKLSSEDVQDVIFQMAEFNQTGNRIYCRLILGAYLGRPMLGYRRVSDFFFRVKSMVSRTRLSKVTEEIAQKVVDFVNNEVAEDKDVLKVYFADDGSKSTKIKSSVFRKCREELSLQNFLTVKDISRLYNRYKINYGRFKKGLCNEHDLGILIYRIIEQAPATSVTKIDAKKIMWEEIAKEMLRSVQSVRRIWNEVILPVLAVYTAGGDIDDQSWKARLIKIILEDESITDRQRVNWDEIQRLHFPNQTKSSLIRALNTDVLSVFLFTKEEKTFRDALHRGYEFLSKDCRKRRGFAKRKKIVELYEMAMEKLKLSPAASSSSS